MELISKEATIEAMCADCQGKCVPCEAWPCDDIKVIQNMPSAQPEIIRCSECTQYRRWIDTDISFCDLTESERTPDDFCSRAERRTDEQHG